MNAQEKRQLRKPVMTMNIEILEAAIDVIDREQCHVSNEIRAWKEFRESIRLVRPVPIDESKPSREQVDLATRYRETVMATPDFDTTYNDTLEESLQKEFSPRLAQAVITPDGVTQRSKRDLLVAASDAIQSREEFHESLENERNSVTEASEVLNKIRMKVEEFPDCSIQTHSLEEFLRIRDLYQAPERVCRKLLQFRQQEISTRSIDIKFPGGSHLFNEYLYCSLETAYPVLSANASTIERIETARSGETSSELTAATVLES